MAVDARPSDRVFNVGRQTDGQVAFTCGHGSRFLGKCACFMEEGGQMGDV